MGIILVTETTYPHSQSNTKSNQPARRLREERTRMNILDDIDPMDQDIGNDEYHDRDTWDYEPDEYPDEFDMEFM